jgi:hypothetical protein
MKRMKLQDMTVDQLVERFTQIGLAQDEAILYSEHAKFNRLYDMMLEVELELKARAGDQRRALLPLYKHPNMQVRVTAATATLAVEPQIARQELVGIASTKLFPQAADASSLVRGLDDGTFKPT